MLVCPDIRSGNATFFCINWSISGVETFKAEETVLALGTNSTN